MCYPCGCTVFVHACILYARLPAFDLGSQSATLLAQSSGCWVEGREAGGDPPPSCAGAAPPWFVEVVSGQSKVNMEAARDVFLFLSVLELRWML